MLKQQQQHALTSGPRSSKPPGSTQHEHDPESPIATVATNSSCCNLEPQNSDKKENNGYKYQQRPWYSVQRWRECQRSIIYAAQREVVRSDSACRRSGGLFEETFGSELIKRDSTRQEQLNAEACFKRQNPVSLWHWREVRRRWFSPFPSGDNVKKRRWKDEDSCAG